MTTSPKKQRSLLARLVAVAVVAVCALILVAAGWFAYTQSARTGRERMSPEAVAGGRGRWVQAADAQLFMQEWGDASKPTVLLTHGTGAWSGTWFTVPTALSAAGWHVVALDLPPFGLSKTDGPAASVDYSRAAQARRVLSFIDALGVPVTLVGHSFGAGPALEAAMHAGNRVRQLVLVDPALGLGADGSAPHCEAPAGGPGWLGDRAARTALVAASATWPGLTAAMLKRFVHRKEVVTDELVPAYQEPFARIGFSAGLGDWAMAFSNSACEHAASLVADNLSAWASGGPPVSLIWGEEDTITPLVQARSLERWMPKATVTVLAGVGHIPHIEDPRAFTQGLLSLLRTPTSGVGDTGR